MTKRILIGIWVIVLARITFDFSLFWDNCLMFIAALSDFDFKISFSHILNVTAFSALLYFIYCCLQYQKENIENKRLSIYKRYSNTLKDHSSILLKSVLVLLPSTVGIFSIVAWCNLPKIPELFLSLLTFTILICLDSSKKQKVDDLVGNSYLFTDEPVEKYSQLNEFQQTEVKNLKNIIDISGKEYLSIALNGSWGSGKTSILKGLKDLLESVDKKEKIEIYNCEVFELNLWQARTPENAISELENLFAELFNKVYLNVSSRDLAFFSLLAESINSGLSSHLKGLIGVNETIPTTRDRIEKKLQEVLSLLGKQKLVILIDDLDRIPDQYLNGFLKIICYVTGLENVITISGINRDKILSQLGKQEELTFWADNVSQSTKLDNEEQKRVSQRTGNWPPKERKKKEELKFQRFDNENFLTKIFSIQRELVNSDYHIKIFVDLNKVNFCSFQKAISFEDKEMIILRIKDFINKNHKYFNSYRDLKLFLNEVFVYLGGFAGSKQNEINLSDYIEIESILAMSWSKVVYPDFYKEVQNYIIPFIYQENINDSKELKASFKLKSFIRDLHSFDDEGENKIINTCAHRQIKEIFSNLKGEKDLTNLDAATKYFRPIIEPYEFTNKEFANSFIDGKTTIEGIQLFIEPKWKLNPQYVLDDFLRRVKSRDFHPTDRLNSAIVLMDVIEKAKKSEEYNIYEQDVNLWIKVISLFENNASILKILGYDRLIKYDNFKSIFSTSLELFLDLWERKYFLIEDIDLTGPGPINFKNTFYRFFNVSDFPEDDSYETKENYKALLAMVSTHKFQTLENKLHCLMFIYNLSYNLWEGMNSRIFSKFHFSEICPFFLESLFNMVRTDYSNDIGSFQNLISDGIRYKADEILFTFNLEKLIGLIKSNISFYSSFLDELKNRKEDCTLFEDQRQLAYEKLIKELDSDPQFFDSGYNSVLRNFFRIDEEFL